MYINKSLCNCNSKISSKIGFSLSNVNKSFCNSKKSSKIGFSLSNLHASISYIHRYNIQRLQQIDH